MFSNIFSPENRAVYEIMWKKYCRAGQATDDNMAHCMLDTYGYIYTLRIWNTHCFCTKAPECYVVCTSPVLFRDTYIKFF
jgi:hypothetical protein